MAVFVSGPLTRNIVDSGTLSNGSKCEDVTDKHSAADFLSLKKSLLSVNLRSDCRQIRFFHKSDFWSWLSSLFLASDQVTCGGTWLEWSYYRGSCSVQGLLCSTASACSRMSSDIKTQMPLEFGSNLFCKNGIPWQSERDMTLVDSSMNFVRRSPPTHSPKPQLQACLFWTSLNKYIVSLLFLARALQDLSPPHTHNHHLTTPVIPWWDPTDR